jgi:hypothetical protein
MQRIGIRMSGIEHQQGCLLSAYGTRTQSGIDSHQSPPNCLCIFINQDPQSIGRNVSLGAQYLRKLAGITLAIEQLHFVRIPSVVANHHQPGLVGQCQARGRNQQADHEGQQPQQAAASSTPSYVGNSGVHGVRNSLT